MERGGAARQRGGVARRPTCAANSRSNASTWGPSGAIQFESNASSDQRPLVAAHVRRGEVDARHPAEPTRGRTAVSPVQRVVDYRRVGTESAQALPRQSRCPTPILSGGASGRVRSGPRADRARHFARRRYFRSCPVTGWCSSDSASTWGRPDLRARADHGRGTRKRQPDARLGRGHPRAGRGLADAGDDPRGDRGRRRARLTRRRGGRGVSRHPQLFESE